jgi:hypothetical protein
LSTARTRRRRTAAATNSLAWPPVCLACPLTTTPPPGIRKDEERKICGSPQRARKRVSQWERKRAASRPRRQKSNAWRVLRFFLLALFLFGDGWRILASRLACLRAWLASTYMAACWVGWRGWLFAARAIYWSRRNSKPSYADAWFLGGQLVWRHADYCGTTVQHAHEWPRL